MHGKCLLTLKDSKKRRWLWKEVNMQLLHGFGVDFTHPSPVWGKSSRFPSLWDRTGLCWRTGVSHVQAE